MTALISVGQEQQVYTHGVKLKYKLQLKFEQVSKYVGNLSEHEINEERISNFLCPMSHAKILQYMNLKGWFFSVTLAL